MHFRTLTIAAAGAIILASAGPSLAARKASKCSSILAVCMERAVGHAAICEDMYRSALSAGEWQATEEPDGTKHPAIPCTK